MTLDEIYEEYQQSPSFKHLREHSNFVPGEGKFNSIMFIGEAPGFTEDKRKKPFVGKAGEVLEKQLNSISLLREDIFITNVVKYRPFDTNDRKKNRTPTPYEVSKSIPCLGKEIYIVNPQTIVLMGRIATNTFYPEHTFRDLRGRFFVRNGRTIFITFHPAAVLYREENRLLFSQDFERLKIFRLDTQRERDI